MVRIIYDLKIVKIQECACVVLFTVFSFVASLIRPWR